MIMYNYLVGPPMDRYHNDVIPYVFDSYFFRKNTTHEYETRQRIKDHKAKLGKHSFSIQGLSCGLK